MSASPVTSARIRQFPCKFKGTYRRQSLGIVLHIIFFPFSTEETTFPSFTICAEYMQSYNEDFLGTYNLSSWQLRKQIKFPKKLSTHNSLHSRPMTSFFENATRSFEEMVKTVDFYVEHQDPQSGAIILRYEKDPLEGEGI